MRTFPVPTRQAVCRVTQYAVDRFPAEEIMRMAEEELKGSFPPEASLYWDAEFASDMDFGGPPGRGPGFCIRATLGWPG